jgi:hypothetical protein
MADPKEPKAVDVDALRAAGIPAHDSNEQLREAAAKRAAAGQAADEVTRGDARGQVTR